jgi:hypothetical protein
VLTGEQKFYLIIKVLVTNNEPGFLINDCAFGLKAQSKSKTPMRNCIDNSISVLCFVFVIVLLPKPF